MEALVQHLLNAGLQTGQESFDVLHQNVVQSLGQVMQAAVSCHAAVLSMSVKELKFCCPSFAYVTMADDVLLTSIDNPWKAKGVPCSI